MGGGEGRGSTRFFSIIRRGALRKLNCRLGEHFFLIIFKRRRLSPQHTPTFNILNISYNSLLPLGAFLSISYSIHL
jgi:hypothetical protein